MTGVIIKNFENLNFLFDAKLVMWINIMSIPSIMKELNIRKPKFF